MTVYLNISTRGWPLISSQSPVISFQQASLLLFASGLFFCIFCNIGHLILMCHYYLINCPVNLSLIFHLRKSVSSLSIKLSATEVSFLLTKKIHLSHSNLPTIQQLYFLCKCSSFFVFVKSSCSVWSGSNSRSNIQQYKLLSEDWIH